MLYNKTGDFMRVYHELEPIYNESSKVLILGKIVFGGFWNPCLVFLYRMLIRKENFYFPMGLLYGIWLLLVKFQVLPMHLLKISK